MHPQIASSDTAFSCLFAPPEPGSTIGNTEQEQVAWCVQPRNNARIIPDGTLQSVHFVKTPLYWQIHGYGDFTSMNIAYGDTGGELDPHGATGDGNPIGGNVTTNATGSDVSYEEWMNYISFDQFCLRICIAENSTYSAANECQHTIDEMGCYWVMPGDYTNNTFTECDGDSAYPPGWYPQKDGSVSTFQQRYTGTATSGGVTNLWTIGVLTTPQAAFSTPATSNCKTFSSVSNGIPTQALTSGAFFTYTSGMTFDNVASNTPKTAAGAGASGAADGSSAGGSNGGSAAGGDSTAVGAKASGSGALSFTGKNYGSTVAVGFTVFSVIIGASAIML